MGAQIRLRSNSFSLLDAALTMLPPASRVVRGGGTVTYSLWRDDAGFRLVRNGARIGMHASEIELLDHFRSRLHETVALHSPHVFVHAGVVAIGGRLVAIPGVSCAGKSTLVAELVRRGATYYSDEYAVLDERGLVHPYPKPLSLRQPSGPPRLTPVGDLGGRVGRRSLPLKLVAMVRYRAGKQWSVRAMSPAETLFALLENTLVARSRPEAVLPVLARAAEGASGLRGVRGEAGEAIAEIAQFMNQN
ncbi:MAG: hypothetical protein U0Q16_34095 [Bryobacteraceae bacterium]